MNIGMLDRRFAIPAWLRSCLLWWRFRCFVSPHAEVDYSSSLSIGRGTRISAFSKIKAFGGQTTIGRNVDIASGVVIGGGTSTLQIGDDTLIGPGVRILVSNYGHADPAMPIRKQEKTSRGVQIGRDVWLGAGVVVLDGSEIGDGVIVTPNSVVNGRLAAQTIGSGIPAKIVFHRRGDSVDR